MSYLSVANRVSNPHFYRTSLIRLGKVFSNYFVLHFVQVEETQSMISGSIGFDVKRAYIAFIDIGARQTSVKRSCIIRMEKTCFKTNRLNFTVCCTKTEKAITFTCYSLSRGVARSRIELPTSGL